MSLIIRNSTVFAASGLHTLVETARGAVWVATVLGIVPVVIDQVVTYVNQKLQIQLRFLMMSDITLETCWTINVLWNSKIPLLSCILLVIATSHTAMHGSMNINFIIIYFFKNFGSLLYTLVHIFITLFLYISVFCSLTWISIFLHVLYWWTSEFCSKDWQYFLIKQVTLNIYKEAKVRILNSLNSCLQDVLELTPAIDQITVFCILNILILNSPPIPPQNSIPNHRSALLWET